MAQVQTTVMQVQDVTPDTPIRVSLAAILPGSDDMNVYGTARDACHLWIDDLGSVIQVPSTLEVEVFV